MTDEERAELMSIVRPVVRTRSLVRPPLPQAETWVATVVGSLLVILVVPPLVFLVSTSMHSWDGLRPGPVSLENFQGILSDGVASLELLKNSLIYAGGSTAIAIVAGSGLAWLVERTNTPGKGAIYVAAFVSLAVPGVISVIGWILLFGPDAGLINTLAHRIGLEGGFFDIFSMGGMVLVESLSWTPVVFLLMVTPFKFMDPSLEEAGLVSGASRWTVFRRITIRMALPSALAALMLSLIRTLESFEAPALIGIPGGVKVLTTEIYLQIKSGLVPEYGSASAYAVILIVLVAVLLWGYSRQTASGERFATVTGKGFRPAVVDLGRLRIVGGIISWATLLLVLAPLLVLVWASLLPYYRTVSWEALQSLTLDNYASALGRSGIVRSVGNTLVVSVVSGVAVMAISLGAAWVMARTSIRGRRGLDLLASLPLVVPGVVAGIAVLRTYIASPIPVYGTIWILAIAFTMRYLPYGMRYAHAGIVQMHPDLEDSARTSGAAFWARIRRVVLPLTLPAMAGGFIFTFLNSSSQLAIPLLLSGPDSQVISVAIFDLYQNGAVTELAAFSVVVTAAIVALSSAAYRITRSQGL